MTPKLSERLSKLIPRLASDADGEVLATVRAIRATLQSDGLDLHDLVAAIDAEKVTPAKRSPQIAGAPCWADLTHQERRAWMRIVLGDPAIGPLEWERMTELDNHLRTGIWFTPHWRRIRLFDERVARLHARGMRP